MSEEKNFRDVMDSWENPKPKKEFNWNWIVLIAFIVVGLGAAYVYSEDLERIITPEGKEVDVKMTFSDNIGCSGQNGIGTEQDCINFWKIIYENPNTIYNGVLHNGTVPVPDVLAKEIMALAILCDAVEGEFFIFTDPDLKLIEWDCEI